MLSGGTEWGNAFSTLLGFYGLKYKKKKGHYYAR